MIFCKVSSRRRVVAKRVASFCGIVLILPLIGCSSQGVGFADNGSSGYGQGATGSVPIPSEPVYGEADSGSAPYWSSQARGGSAPVAGAYKEASIERGTLAPVNASYAHAGAQEPPIADAGGSYAIQPIEAHDAAPAPSASQATYRSAKRYAGSVPSYYDRQPKDYRPQQDGYEPHGQAYEDQPHGQAHEDQTRGGYAEHGSGPGDDYVVVPGDTLFSIAQRHGMTTAELTGINRLDGPTIHPGQRLRVRGPQYTSANRYKAPAGYDPGDRDHGGGAYADDDRKSPPAYTGERGARYDSYSGYAASKPKPYYAHEDEDRGRAPAPSYYDGQPRAQKRYETDKLPHGEERSYAQAPASADEQSDADGQDEDGAPAYAEREPQQAKPPYYADRQQEPRRYARADEHEDERGDPRYAPRRTKSKGSYETYAVGPGETLRDVAHHTGLSERELAEYNDIPSSARLYTGQVLRVPKGKTYDRSERHEEGENQDDRSSDRRGRRPGYDDRTSQKAPQPGEPRLNERERRVAKASGPQDGHGPRAGDVAVTGQPEADRGAGGNAGPILAAAQRDMGAADAQPGGESAGARDCESLLANPAGRSAQTFREPVQGVMLAKFGSKTDGSFNDGIDFSVPKGTPVKASENGVVAYAGNELPGFGNLVLVRHADGFVTAYAHNDELLVHRCDVVKRGQIISKAGVSGNTQQPELHFELRKDSKPVDPVAFFARS